MCVRWHWGAGVSTVASQPDGLWGQGFLSGVCIFSPCVCVGSLLVRWFPPTVQRRWVNW